MTCLHDRAQGGETQPQLVCTVGPAQVTAAQGISVSRPSGASPGPAKGQA